MKQKLLGNLKEGLLFVVSAPSGAGKTTLVHMICEEFEAVVRCTTCTTRPPRSGEVEGKDYHFITAEEFQQKERAKEFLESAQVFNDRYGTLKEEVYREQKRGKHVILVIDTQGAFQLRGKIPAVFIFVAPPSLGELKRRLIVRKTENEKSIEERLSWAEREIEEGKKFDYFIFNEDLNLAYQVLRSIFIAEERHIRRSLCPSIKN
ncbi:MAG: guanylate kinase [Chlamydiae bacterium RIFCSPLOWO2_02_FULL_49_12]|nr:MAG: guanylate kinase [Chlamydiae bacterium RIFCSPLOWO2_02_FULL_49_12]